MVANKRQSRRSIWLVHVLFVSVMFLSLPPLSSTAQQATGTWEEQARLWEAKRGDIKFAMTKETVRRVLGMPQAIGLLTTGHQEVQFFGPTPRNHIPVALGPIVVTYDQYDNLLEVYLVKGTAAASPAGPNDASEFKEKIRGMAAGTARHEVERKLGSPQAYRVIRGEPRATGPALAHMEAYYGPDPPRIPIRLGPISVRFNAIQVESVCAPEKPPAGLDTQNWSLEEIERSPLPMQVGWHERFSRIAPGMAKSEVEKYLGKSRGTEEVFSGGVSDVCALYGPSQFVSPNSAWLSRRRIEVAYNNEGEVVKLQYNRDNFEYEWQRLEPGQERE